MSLNQNSPAGDPNKNLRLLELIRRVSNAELGKGKNNYNYNNVLVLASKAVKSIEAAVPELNDSDRLALWNFFRSSEIKITLPE